MKRIALATAVLIAFASTASAMNNFNELSGAAVLEIHLLVPNADLSNLSSGQVGQLELALYGGDDAGRASEIRSILN
jgi:hypothetical protein